MTREEAVKMLEYIKHTGNGESAYKNCRQENALNMAIEALSAEPCEDAISRKAIIEYYDSDEYKSISRVTRNGLLDFVEDLPSVSPARKKGKWIGHGEHCENIGVIPNGLAAYEWCSNCDCAIDVREWHRNSYKYCPNCGAEMESD